MAIIHCTCGSIAENPDTGLCASCGRLGRKAESDAAKAALKAKSKKPVKPISEKRKKDNLIYSKRRKHYLDKYPNCQLKLIGCTIIASEIHHVNGRIGSNLTNTNGFKSACHSCHRQLHDKLSAKEARAKGLKGTHKPLTQSEIEKTENLF